MSLTEKNQNLESTGKVIGVQKFRKNENIINLENNSTQKNYLSLMRNLSKIICATIFQLYHKCFSAIGYRTHFYNPENFGGYWGWQLLGIDKGSLKL